MIQNVKKIWQKEYKCLLSPIDEQHEQQPSRRQPSIVEQYLCQAQVPHDEFDSYIKMDYKANQTRGQVSRSMF
jgi:hypothetical protein